MITLQDIKKFVKSLFTHWLLDPFAIFEIISEKNKKPINDATTKLNDYKQFYK